MTHILGIIPARGGSKGIPRKNMYPLAGKPLIWYTFQAAQASTMLTRTILTTDDEAIADYGRQQQIEVPFMRPPELAQDDTPSPAVIQHALDFLADDYQPDLIVLLQPTAPLRQGQHIDAAIQLLLDKNGGSVVSVALVPAHCHPYWSFVIDENTVMQPFDSRGGPQRYSRRQLLPSVYYRNGAVYVIRRELIQEQNTLYGKNPLAYIMPPDVSVNIDDIEDIWMAERKILKGTQT